MYLIFEIKRPDHLFQEDRERESEENNAGAIESNRSEKAGKISQASDDDLGKKILQNLRGDNNEEEIEMEIHQTGDPVAELPGARRGGDIKARQRRVLKVGYLNIRLPVPKSSTTPGENAEMPRGKLAAKILRWARQATSMPSRGDAEPAMSRRGSTRQFPAGTAPPKVAALRRSLHSSAVAEADLRGQSQS